MKVPSLIEFYNNQNQLAVQAASQTASNQTSANLESARLGADAKRQQQVEQLERFKELMANMRQERGLTSAEGISMAQIQAEDARSKLGRDFQGSEAAAERQFRQELSKFEQAGAEQRLNTQLSSAKELAGMNIEADRENTALKLAAEAPEQAARTSLYQQQAKALGGPDIEGTITMLTQIASNRKELSKALGGDKQLRILTESLTKRISDAGIDPTTVPAVVEANAPDVKARAANLAKTLDTEFSAMQKQGAIQYIQQAQVELQTLISQGLINDPAAAMKKLQSEAKRLGVTSDDL